MCQVPLCHRQGTKMQKTTRRHANDRWCLRGHTGNKWRSQDLSLQSSKFPRNSTFHSPSGFYEQRRGGRVLGGRWQEAGGQGAAVCGAGAPIGGGSPRPLGGHESQLGRERRLLPASPESTSSSFSRARARGTGASSCHTASSAPFAPRRHLSALASLPSSKLFLAIR